MQFFGRLAGFDDLGYGPGDAGDIIPSLAAEEDPVGEQPARQAVRRGGQGEEGGVRHAAVGNAPQDS